MDTTVYLIRKGRLHIIDEPDMASRILGQIKDAGQALSEFEFYKKHRPVYMVIDKTEKTDDPKYAPLDFPEPQNYGITARQMYAMAVTYRDAMKKFIMAILKKKPSMAAEIKKIMVLAFPIAIMVFFIFVMVLTIGG